MNAGTTPQDPTTRFVPCSLIDWKPLPKGERTLDKDAIGILATSIQIEGMHHAVTLVPSPQKPGRFLGIIGRHRFIAVSETLKMDLIEARVREDMDAELIGMAQRSENLYRSPQSKMQQAVSIARWNEAYERKHAEYEAAVAAKKAARKAEREAAAGAEAEESPHNAAKSDPKGDIQPSPADAPLPAKLPRSFPKHVSEITGQSRDTVERLAKIGKAFDEEQAVVLDEHKVGTGWSETIAKLDPGDRAEVVKLIASGARPAEAIAEVQGTDTVQKADGGVSVVVAKGEEAMSDREWLDTYCGEVLAVLPHRAAYEADAILYRATRDLRTNFGLRVQKRLKQEGPKGAFRKLMDRFVLVPHPKNWLRCGKCLGHGVLRDEGNRACVSCSGGGFVTSGR